MIELRPQQIDFEECVRDAFRRNRCVLGVATTGFGKSVVCADMAEKAVARGNDVLVVTNRRAIVKQLADACETIGLRAGVVMGSEEEDKYAPVQVASIATLKRRKFVGVRKPGFIILDEAHQENLAYKRLIQERFADVKVLGLTATPVGSSGKGLSHFDVLVEPVKNSEVIESGNLLQVNYIAPSEPDLGGINIKTATQDAIAGRVEECTVWGNVFEEWDPYRELQTLVVVQSRAICSTLHEMFVKRGYAAEIVDGTTHQADRDSIFRRYKAGEVRVLLGVDVVREGLDLPGAQCLLDLQVNHQFRTYWQKLGRVKRMYPGQDRAVVVDMAGNLWRHMIHPDHDPPWEELTKGTIEDLIAKKAGKKCPACGSDGIYGPDERGRYKCEDCQEIFTTSKPWVCPHCKQALSPGQKAVGGVCPNCGEKSSERPQRKVRMEDGSFRVVEADEIKKRKKKNEDADQALWSSIIYRVIRSNRNTGKDTKLYACGAMFRNDKGYWPPERLKPYPKREADWKLTPNSVFHWIK